MTNSSKDTESTDPNTDLMPLCCHRSTEPANSTATSGMFPQCNFASGAHAKKVFNLCCPAGSARPRRPCRHVFYLVEVAELVIFCSRIIFCSNLDEVLQVGGDDGAAAEKNISSISQVHLQLVDRKSLEPLIYYNSYSAG